MPRFFAIGAVGMVAIALGTACTGDVIDADLADDGQGAGSAGIGSTAAGATGGGGGNTTAGRNGGGTGSTAAGRDGGGSPGHTPAAGSGGSPSTAPDCAAPAPGRAPLRRLSNAEYRNTVSDLLSQVPDIGSVVATATREFPQEAESLGFRNSAEFLTVQPLLAQKYMVAAEDIAERAAGTTALVPCTPQAGAEMDCARMFIRELGGRAYRRPLAPEESARFEAQFQEALDRYDFRTSVEWFVFTLLQSPAFLHRVEVGAGRPTPAELASRLSYLFWQSQPDAALLEAAAGGELDTPAGVERQARRLLVDPRSARLFQYFAEWLDLDRLDEFTRDDAVFPDLDSELPRLMQQETKAFVDALLRRDDGNLTELFTAPYTFANAKLARHYGLSGASGDGFVRVEAPHASGVLTQAMLAVQDKPYRTSIVRRGLKVRTDFLCQNVPAPPNDVPLSLEASGSTGSQRERLEQHRSDPNCSGCHALLDPIGLVFENFDAVGRYRTKDEAGGTIVSTSEITATRDANGTVTGPRELGELLASSSEARECYVKQTFRFFFGREVEAADACTVARLNAAFQEKGSNLKELLIALTQSDAFLYRNENQEAP